MEDFIKKAKELLEAVKEMHPQLNIGDKKQERLYMAYHSLAFGLAEREKNNINTSEPHLPLGDVSGSLQFDSPVNALREWIHLEITERREYTASKTFEEVLKKINILFPDKCICKTVAQAEDCDCFARTNRNAE